VVVGAARIRRAAPCYDAAVASSRWTLGMATVGGYGKVPSPSQITATGILMLKVNWRLGNVLVASPGADNLNPEMLYGAHIRLPTLVLLYLLLQNRIFLPSRRDSLLHIFLPRIRHPLYLPHYLNNQTQGPHVIHSLLYHTHPLHSLSYSLWFLSSACCCRRRSKTAWAGS
jgi:hypothetical protein